MQSIASPAVRGGAGAAAANAKSCGLPAKTRVSWANEAKVTANVIGKCASDNPLVSRYAKSCAKPACTKANSENEVRVIVRGIVKPVAASSLKAVRVDVL